MKTCSVLERFCRRNAVLSSVAGILVLALFSAGWAHASITDGFFDFNDAYYQQNGVNPSAIAGRHQLVLLNATTNTPPLISKNHTRSLLTLPAYGGGGEVEFFTMLGGGNTSMFTADVAGARARHIADSCREYVFPKRGTNPVSLAAVGRGFMLDTCNGYFSNDELGLWLHAWVSYTDEAFNTREGQKPLADLVNKQAGGHAAGTRLRCPIPEPADHRPKG